MAEPRDSLDSFEGLEQSRDDYEEDDGGGELGGTGGLDSSSDSAALQRARILANNSLDETVDVSDAESSVDFGNNAAAANNSNAALSNNASVPAVGKKFGQQPPLQQSQQARRKGDSPPQTASEGEEDRGSMYDEDDEGSLKQDQNRSSYSADEGESSDGEDDVYQKRGLALSQNFDYSQLNVTHEIKELFEFIDKFKPADIELQTALKPFIPEYIPAVGDIDAFLKVARADGKPEFLGLTVLDEPSTMQTDPTVLELQLRAQTKRGDLQPVTVRGIEQADKNTKAVKAWVQRIGDLHRTKPAPTVTYAKPMPDIDGLMQEWPNELEKLLETVKLPSADLDVDIKTFSRIICAVVDIPIYNNITESLHVLFCLYSAFRENSHFRR